MDTYKEKRDLIIKGNIVKAILALAGPIMLNNLIQTIYNLTDTYWVGQLGGTEVAAITLIWPIVFFLLALGFGINIAGTSLISQYTGADDKENATRVSGQIVSFSLYFSIIIGIIGLFVAEPIIKMMGGEGRLLELASNYLKIIFAGMPAIFLFLAFTSIKQGQGDTVTPMKYSAISVALNMVLDPIFIFGLDLGVRGAALATIFSRSVFAIYAIYTLFYRKTGIQLHLKHLILKPNLLKKIIKIGLPSSLGQSSAALGFIFLNAFIISFGKSTLAAFGIGNRINSVILMPAMGIGNALATIVGQNLGADQIKRARQAVKTSAVLTTVLLTSGGIILYPFVPTIIRAFNTEPAIVSQGTFYLRLISLSLPLMGFFQIFVGTFQGSGHTLMAMFIMTGRLWALRIPLIILFKKYTDWGSSSVWYAMVLSNAIISLVGFIMYLTGKWQKKVIKKKPPLTGSEVDQNLDIDN
ncbi:MATE family efflux transporter [Halothermothrix orenii]|uniref:MATE efflux family protein n=1 Tax=Halothermothrix orenii (strain H 168 / OCM 544 / DSM 9562) TaxID=373903 RepID=B8D214_HALOH|nr:MATE family efflux transporter [Halothermothrix orenii]ACL69241.1 MATE efflux family protein [Halothermothrix orenii H 168]